MNYDVFQTLEELNMNKKSFKTYKNLALITQIGLEMVLPIIASVWLGQKIMQMMNWGSIVLLISILMGVTISFLNLFRRAASATSESKRKKNEHSKRD